MPVGRDGDVRGEIADLRSVWVGRGGDVRGEIADLGSEWVGRDGRFKVRVGWEGLQI